MKHCPHCGKLLKQKVVLSSNKQDWMTPEYVLYYIRQLAPIALDPAGSFSSYVNAWWTYCGPNHIDGLAFPWLVPDDLQVFCNPPYGRQIKLWCAKAAYEAAINKRQHQTLLIPARVGTGYWRDYVWPTARAVCFWNGGDKHPARITFLDAVTRKPAKAGATFDAAIPYWGPDPERFQSIFQAVGEVQLL